MSSMQIVHDNAIKHLETDKLLRLIEQLLSPSTPSPSLSKLDKKYGIISPKEPVVYPGTALMDTYI
jgi:hypothetical protein